MDPALILLIVMGLSVLVFIAFAVLGFTRVAIGPAEAVDEPVLTEGDQPEQEPDRRPWWARHSAWLLVAILFLVLGLFVAPKLFGGVFLFFPFFWFRSPRRRRPPSPQ